MNCYNKNYIQNKGKMMKFYSVCIMSLMLMGTYLQADATTKEPVCKSIVECDKLIHAIEVKIDDLKAKGLSNLSREEKIKYISLKKQLLAAQKAKTARERAKNAELDKEIASKDTELKEAKAKTAIEKMETRETEKTNKKLDELGALLK